MKLGTESELQHRHRGGFTSALVLGVLAWVPSILAVATSRDFSDNPFWSIFLLAALGWGYLLAGIALYLCYRRPRDPLTSGAEEAASTTLRTLALFVAYGYLLTPLLLIAYGFAFGVGKSGYQGP